MKSEIGQMEVTMSLSFDHCYTLQNVISGREEEPISPRCPTACGTSPGDGLGWRDLHKRLPWRLCSSSLFVSRHAAVCRERTMNSHEILASWSAVPSLSYFLLLYSPLSLRKMRFLIRIQVVCNFEMNICVQTVDNASCLRLGWIREVCLTEVSISVFYTVLFSCSRHQSGEWHQECFTYFACGIFPTEIPLIITPKRITAVNIQHLYNMITC